MKILKIPYNAGAMKKKEGQELAPDKIIECLDELYLTESGLNPNFEIEEVKINNQDIDSSKKSIEDAVKKLNEFAILIGGDHSITYSGFKGFVEKHKHDSKKNINTNCGLLIFDAHPDCENDFITHEDFINKLISDEIIKPSNIMLVGIRNWSENEHNFIKKHKIKNYTMKEISFEGLNETCDAVMAAARAFENIYLSIDIDVLDPAFAPGTGYIEPGGLTSRELLYFIQRLKLLKNIKIIDIVEVNPKKDFNNMTSKMAAKLIVELS